LGGLLGLAAAYLLTSQTQQAWPINTGGMPIVSNWTNLIVIFELTMLGAVFATVITLILTAGLFSRLPKFYDPAVSQGKILIGAASSSPARADIVETTLRATSSTAVKTVH
jgi:hypothetical protein